MKKFRIIVLIIVLLMMTVILGCSSGADSGNGTVVDNPSIDSSENNVDDPNDTGIDNPETPNTEPESEAETDQEPEQEIENLVPESIQGQWLYIHSGEKTWIGSKTVLNYTQIDENLLKVTTAQGQTVFLIKAGTTSVPLNGKIDHLSENAISGDKPNRVAANLLTPSGYTGIGSVNIIFQNIRDEEVSVTTTTDSTGAFEAELPSGTYEMVASYQEPDNPQDGTGGQVISMTTQIVVEGESTDLGNFTLTGKESYNFKTEILDKDYLYFGTCDGQDTLEYHELLRVWNIGSKDVSGLSFKITCDDSDVRHLSYQNVLGGIPYRSVEADNTNIDDPLYGQEATNKLDLPFDICFKRPLTDKEVRIEVQITDLNDRTWHDYVVVTLSAHAPVRVNIDTNETSSGIYGYLVTPGRTLKRIASKAGERQSLMLPYIPDQYHELVLSNPSVSSESAYYISIGNYSNDHVYESFTKTNINEPDNDVSNATVLGLYDKITSYLHAGDIDYFKIRFDNTNVPFDPKIMGTSVIEPRANDIATDGNYAYISYRNNLMQVLDIRDPQHPVLSNTLNFNPYSYSSDILLSGNYLYVLEDEVGLQIIDISTPSAPKVVAFVELSNKTPEHMVLAGNYIYLMEFTSGLIIIDIGDPENPKTVSTTLWGNSAFDVSLTDHYALTTDMSETMRILDIDDPSNPILIGSVALPNDKYLSYSDNVFVNGIKVVYSVVPFGGYAFCSDYFGGLLAVDIFDPTRPIIENQITFDTFNASDVEISGHYIFQTTEDGFIIYDVSDAPEISVAYESKNLLEKGKKGITLSGNNLYVVDEQQNFNIIKLK